MFDLLFQVADLGDGVLLHLPLRLARARFLAQSGQLDFELLQPLLRMRVGFVQQRLALDFQMQDAPLDFINFDGQRIQLHAQARGGFVDQVDGLVRKKPVGDVAVGKRGGRQDRRVLNAHAVVQLVALFQSAQNRDGVFDGRLGNQDRLEAALERRILLDVFAVFVERGRADRAQFAARQRRLQHVGRVHRAFRRACAHQRVQLVDEQNDLPFGFGDFLQHGFQAVFKFAAVFRAGNQRRKVQSDDALRAQHFGHIARDDSLREPFDDGRLADARLADQDGIIFRAPRENLHDAADFIVAADDRIEFAAPRQFDQVAAVLFQRAERRFRILRRHAVAAAHGRERLQDRFARRAMLGQQLGGMDLCGSWQSPAGCARRKRTRP